jgi:Ca2+-binding RTX toxin-like protein
MLVDNAAPVLTGEPIDDQLIDWGVAWSYDFSGNMFTDADGHPLLYFATLGDGSDLPEWLSFHAATRLFEGLAPGDAGGDYEIRVTASDGVASTSTTFTLSVAGEVEGLTLTGTWRAEVLTGGAGADTIIGGGGHDILSGGGGDYVFLSSGNPGFDIYDGGAGLDVIMGGSGNDVIGVRASAVVNAAGETTFVLLAGIEEIRGGDGFDVLRLENTADFLDLTNVFVTDIERISGAGGPYTIIGSAGNDIIDGGGHHDSLFGGLGDDTFVFAGNSGFDFYDGGEGFDTILGSEGNDVLLFARGADDLVSIERIDLGEGFDILRMHNVSDVLDLTGFEVSGLEQIEGGAGGDWIRGSAGNEIIFGGSRSDVFYFAGIFGQDTIADFELRLSPRVNGDRIDLTSFGFSSFEAVMAVTREVQGNSRIELAGVDSSITILNIAKLLLEPDDFLV